jgi:hypothetical protein
MQVMDLPIKLTWDDLLIEDPSLGYERLLEDWSWLLKGAFRVLAASKFGDWFVERPSGPVEMLDAMEGNLREVAPSRAEFQRLINTYEKQEEWLLSELVLALHEKGVVPAAGQCYAFKVPPILAGQVDSESVEVMDLAVWVSICGQLHRQVQAMSPGTRISGLTLKKE